MMMKPAVQTSIQAPSVLLPCSWHGTLRTLPLSRPSSSSLMRQQRSRRNGRVQCSVSEESPSMENSTRQQRQQPGTVKAVVRVKQTVRGCFARLGVTGVLNAIQDVLLGKTIILELVSIELDPDMEKYFKRKATDESFSQQFENVQHFGSSVRPRVELNLDELPIDPAKRKSIAEFDFHDREIVRRYYWQKGPCQPKIVFPWRQFGNESRRFIFDWFKSYPSWLEYSISKDAAFCLCCYLFKSERGNQGGGDIFISEGFTNWKKGPQKFKEHIGDHNSFHSKSLKFCLDLMNQKQHIEICISKQSDQARVDYRTRLTASVDCIRFLLRQGLAFRGHHEYEESNNRAPTIQKDIVNAAAIETTTIIINDLGDDLFSILVDESRDISVKEQMIVFLRFVDKQGCIIERFLGAIHVIDTKACSLYAAIVELLARHGLSISCLRGQGYDGASNMQGEFNGLKSLIQKENPTAFYIHCFAHQLQLALVAVVQKERKLATFFNIVLNISNIVGASCKRRDILREKQFERVIEEIYTGELKTGRGLNQETVLKRAGDTRWGSHYGTLLSLISLFPSVIEVLEIVADDGKVTEKRGEANMLVDTIQCFEFVFLLHLMKDVLGITNELSQTLQRKDQDIVNAMNLVTVSKSLLQNMRDNGWDSLLYKVSLFCNKYGINIPSMDENFIARRKSQRRAEEMTNLHHYRVEIFNVVIDLQLQELNSRFNEVNSELLLCMACLDPRNSFSAFDKKKLIRFAEFYPSEFSYTEIEALDLTLDTYFQDVRTDNAFSKIAGIGELAQKMVQTNRHLVYPSVYLLIKLALILPVATASVERAFSAMNIIKTSLRNRMGDDWLNDCLVTYIEKDIFDSVQNEDIIRRFQNMKPRRGLL